MTQFKIFLIVFQEFQTNDLNKLIFHATIPMAVLESTKSTKFTNIFDFDKEQYEAIKRDYPSFSSERFNLYINSLVENVKELKLDNIEYALYSVALTLSNGNLLFNFFYLKYLILIKFLFKLLMLIMIVYYTSSILK